jgi:hypothetical protein
MTENVAAITEESALLTRENPHMKPRSMTSFALIPAEACQLSIGIPTVATPTNWPASPGPPCPAANNIAINRCSQRQLDGRGNDAPLGKQNAFHFSTATRTEALQ